LTKKKDSSFSEESTEKQKLRSRYPRGWWPVQSCTAQAEQKKVFWWAAMALARLFSFKRLPTYPQDSVFAAGTTGQQQLCRPPESGSNSKLVCLSVEMCRVVWCPQAVMRTQTARS
jgi:hypothetical protein